MEKEQRNRILLYFDEETLKKEAVFGIYHGADQFEHHHIRANKEGLEMYALQLLKAAKEIDDAEEPGLLHVPVVCNESWINSDSDVVIEDVVIINERVPEPPPVAAGNRIVTTVGLAGCFGILVLIIVSLVVGVVTVFDWLF